MRVTDYNAVLIVPDRVIDRPWNIPLHRVQFHRRYQDQSVEVLPSQQLLDILIATVGTESSAYLRALSALRSQTGARLI